MSVICPYQGCGGYTLLIKCPLCQMRTIYSGQTESINEGKNISCPKENLNLREIIHYITIIYQF